MKKRKINIPLLLSLLFLSVVTIGALCAGMSPYDPNKVDLLSKFQESSAEHLFGTDNFGRDYFTRILYGSRVSLSVGALATLVTITFGTLYGIISGLSSRLVDAVMMRFVDILMSVPYFLVIITLNVYLDTSIATTVLTISIFFWMRVARIVRAEVLSLRERDFVLAAKGLGASKSWIIFRHMIKNVSSSVIVASTDSIAGAILTESTLSYLGFGIKIPNASWGGMLENAQTYILTRPILAVYPGLCILLTVLSFNVLGTSLRTILDPKSKR